MSEEDSPTKMSDARWISSPGKDEPCEQMGRQGVGSTRSRSSEEGTPCSHPPTSAGKHLPTSCCTAHCISWCNEAILTSCTNQPANLPTLTKFTQRFMLLACQTNHSMSSLTLCQKANLTLPKRLIRFVAGILGVVRTYHKIIYINKMFWPGYKLS